jgi:hypothetical protein
MSTITSPIIDIAQGFGEFENKIFCQIGGIVSRYLQALSGLNIHENDFIEIGSLGGILR